MLPVYKIDKNVSNDFVTYADRIRRIGMVYIEQNEWWSIQIHNLQSLEDSDIWNRLLNTVKQDTENHSPNSKYIKSLAIKFKT